MIQQALPAPRSVSPSLTLRQGLLLLMIVIAAGALFWRCFEVASTTVYRGSQYFDGAVGVMGASRINITVPSERFVYFTLHRSGPYRFYPPETYIGEIMTDQAVSPPQPFTLETGAETTQQRVKVEWQWEQGSQAEQKGWMPLQVNVKLTRKSDGKTEDFWLKVGTYLSH